MFHKIILSILNIFNFFIIIRAAVSNKDYASMPTLFELDNYDQCMLQEENALFCTFTFTLEPIQKMGENKIWNIIQNISADPRNYKHDRLRHGICVSTTCPNTTDISQNVSIEKRIELCYNKKYNDLGLKGNISEMICLTNHSAYPIDVYDIAVGVFFISYILLIVFASIYEGIARKQERDIYEKTFNTKVGKVIAAFSIINNYYRLTSPRKNPDAEKLRAIQGIRFYTMICVILCHTIMAAFAGPVTNPKYVENITKNPLNMFVANGQYVVQTFMVISGWLLSLHFFQIIEERKSISTKHLVLTFVNRYIRLTPTLAAVLAFESTWLVHVGKGPLWNLLVEQEYKNCRLNWWTNILYINNYVGKKSLCMSQTWYLAADIQLFIVSLVLLMIASKVNQNKIKIVFGTAIVVGILIPALHAFINNVDIVIRQYPEALYNMNAIKTDTWYDLYSSGHSNVTGYIIGLMSGYLFYKYRNIQLPVKRIHIVLWWILSFGLCIFIILIASMMYQTDYTYTRLEAALYWAFGKNLFALGIAIFIFGLTQNMGWFAKWFCEWKSVQVLGRVTYSTYIIHITIIHIRAGLSKTPVYINDYLMIHLTLGDITLSYLGGTLLCLTIEMPISALQKMMISNSLAKQTETPKPEKSLKTINQQECYNGNKNEDKICTKV